MSYKTYVSSTVLNLLGDNNPSPWLASTLVGLVMQGSDQLGFDSVSSLLDGPAYAIRRYFSWCRTNNYNSQLQLSESQLYARPNIDAEALEEYLVSLEEWDDDTESIYAQIVNYSIDDFDYTYIADKFVIENYPEYINDDYAVDIESEGYPAEGNYKAIVTVTFSDGNEVSFDISDWDTTNTYLYIEYIVTRHIIVGWEYPEPEETEPGPEEEPDDEDEPSDEDNPDEEEPEPEVEPVPIIEITTEYKYVAYGYQTGNSFYDEFFTDPEPLEGSYASPIVIRTYNEFVDEMDDDWHSLNVKAWKKSTGGTKKQYTDMVNELKDNDSIDDIDFIFLTFGPNLNLGYSETNEYIYEFFRYIYDIVDYHLNAPATDDPSEISKGDRNQTTLKVYSNSSDFKFDFRYKFGTIGHYYGTGLCVEDAKENKYYITAKSERYTSGEETDEYGNTYPVTSSAEFTRIYHQINENFWECIELTGLVHYNYVYGSTAVKITAVEAMEDEDPSGFIVPIQEEAWKSMNLVHATQAAQSCYNLVCNCYVRKKKKWYEKGIFKWVTTIVVTIIIAWASWGTATGLGGWILGAMGFNTGLDASLGTLIASAAINSIAGAIVGAVVTNIATSIFGGVLGSIIGMIGSMYAMGLTAGMGIGTMTQNMLEFAFCTWQGILNTLNCIFSLGNQAVVQTQMKKLQKEEKEFEEDYSAIQKELTARMYELANNTLDSVFIVACIRGNTYEICEVYLARTLWKASDIREAQLALVHDFCDNNLKLEYLSSD